MGRRIGTYLQAGDVLALRGRLAAGKTTLVKGIAQALGVRETITSPTFTLISEYEGTLPLYHMDVYRLNGELCGEEFYNLGAEELVYGTGVCVIEWSEKVSSELPDSAIIISIETLDSGSRSITVSNWKYGDILS